MVPSVLHDRPDEEAVRRVARAKPRASTRFGIVIARPGPSCGRAGSLSRAPEHQAIIDAAYFYLNTSTHSASPSATSIFGLATWHDYTIISGT